LPLPAETLVSMAQISIENRGNLRLQVPGVPRTLLSIVQENHVDWMHACGGKGRCTTCKTIVVQGLVNTGPITAPEQRYRDAGALKPGERLACQMTVLGNITVRVPHECKLPHISYTDDPES
jgi:ferredoxin, 2Fe-2S